MTFYKNKLTFFNLPEENRKDPEGSKISEFAFWSGK